MLWISKSASNLYNKLLDDPTKVYTRPARQSDYENHGSAIRIAPGVEDMDVDLPTTQLDSEAMEISNDLSTIGTAVARAPGGAPELLAVSINQPLVQLYLDLWEVH